MTRKQLEDAADLLEWYLNENIPAQETIGAFELVDAVRKAAAAVESVSPRDAGAPWSTFTLGAFHGCFTGDCPHERQEECLEALREYVRELCKRGLELERELSKLGSALLSRIDELELDGKTIKGWMERCIELEEENHELRERAADAAVDAEIRKRLEP